MNRDDLFKAVKSAKDYGGICDETVLRVIEGAMPKYKSGKLVLKSVKSTLREISAAFLSDSDLRLARRIVEEIDWQNLDDVIIKTKGIFDLHQSTKERSGHFAGMIGDIKKETGFKSVLDIGCGLYPFIIPHVDGIKDVTYYAMDIHTGAIKLVNELFEGLGLSGQAFAGDILINVPDIKADCAFLFKLLPLLARLDKNGAERVVRELNCRYAAVSFPTRSISGKNVGMRNTYDAFMGGALGGFPVLLEKEYTNEVLYILKLS